MEFDSTFRSAFSVAPVLLAAILCSACSTVYSPFAQMPPEPLRSGETQVLASGNALPETRPEGNFGGFVSAGGEFLARYAFSDRITLGARTWGRLSNLSKFQVNGVALEGLIRLNDTSASIPVALMPRGMMLLGSGGWGGWDIQGYAAYLGAVAWLPKVWVVRPYLAGGPAYGFINHSSPNAWGYALIGNIGGNVELVDGLNMGGEVAGIFQHNRYDHSDYLFLLPSLSMSYAF